VVLWNISPRGVEMRGFRRGRDFALESRLLGGAPQTQSPLPRLLLARLLAYHRVSGAHEGRFASEGGMVQVKETADAEDVREGGSGRISNADSRRPEPSVDALLEGIGEGFFALDPHWRFTAFNRAAEEIFALSRAAVLGRTIWEVSPRIIGTEFERRYRRVMSERTREEFEDAS
jgi:PAS domain-containing protein